jgi:predicted glycogen debranching enzyme
MQLLIPVMTPSPGGRLQRFVGDRVRFLLKDRDGRKPITGWRALLRTNLGRATEIRREIIHAHTKGLPLAGASWRDLTMREEAEGWSLELPLTEVGYFKAKAYLVDPRGWQHWSTGPDTGISVHPDQYRTRNSIYCAFTRLFGKTKTAISTRDAKQERVFAAWDNEGYTVIPPSANLRDLLRQLPHIIETLGCRIVQLLPVNPTPTTYARFGRFGSPYAALDLTAIDPALVVFDKRTTGIDQFKELTYGTHLRGGRVFLDLVINHTGWGSVLQENHPEWFLRKPEGTFVSPGAWGVTWEDLVELKHQNVELWDVLAEVFLTWCRRGVDGFRCDAGYKVPVAAWQYIVAKVQQEYPETIFLLEGLGGAWEITEALLTEGGMQWAYSELFQNYSGVEVAAYLDKNLNPEQRPGLLVHYSETHDNERLAVRGRAWSLLRNRLCALASISGGFGFTCGVEWLATEKIDVHGQTGLAWGSKENLIPELAALNQLLADHPCFFEGAQLTRLSPADSPIYALSRESEEGEDTVLVLVNTDVERSHPLTLDLAGTRSTASLKSDQTTVKLANWVDLLGQPAPEIEPASGGKWIFTLTPGAAYCLAPTPQPRGLHGDDYRRARAQAAWAMVALSRVLPAEAIPHFPWRRLAKLVEESPARLLAAIASAKGKVTLESPLPDRFPMVVKWMLPDHRRITLIPPGHWLLIQDTLPFRGCLKSGDAESSAIQHVESIPVQEGHVACFAPGQSTGHANLILERYAEKDQHVQATIRFLTPAPHTLHSALCTLHSKDLVLLTNGRGGMARLCVDLGRIQSKYDCLLGANLHPALPVDRHIFAKRIRVWVNADGFISPLDFTSLAAFEPGPPAVWNFVANAGDGRMVEIQLRVNMLEGRNTTVLDFSRPASSRPEEKELPMQAEVRLTARVDIEDRNFHSETRRNGGAEHHFSTHTHPIPSPSSSRREEALTSSDGNSQAPAASEPQFAGFAFTPASDRQLRVFTDCGSYNSEPEWCDNIPHPIEQSRGQVGSGDAFSPGWFDLPLAAGARVSMVVTAEVSEMSPDEQDRDLADSKAEAEAEVRGQESENEFEEQLVRAARSFVVRRDTGKTVIAGYPWFLDWGRDTFICARGLLAAGMVDEVKQILITFARFEKDGTLPNTIHGEDASNRDTSDAPLWFAVVCEEVAAFSRKSTSETGPHDFYDTPVVVNGRTIRQVLESIALNYMKGTPNGIQIDSASGLVWSPSHFTWMDTNYPACTPREGYPVEIQALWIRLLRQLERITDQDRPKNWSELASRALASLEKYFWVEKRGWYADVLLAGRGGAAAEAQVDDALRSNCLFVISLGLVSGERARRCADAALRHLLVPGAMRSLAPLPVSVPLPNHGNDGALLNNPAEPYWARYEGDEDTRRKPAYHNGTAWTWTLPVFCEALARAWEFSPEAVAAAKAYLGSMDRLLAEGCIGHVPEILDGDAPHAQRGCDAQAWGATEALRVWKLLAEQ